MSWRPRDMGGTARRQCRCRVGDRTRHGPPTAPPGPPQLGPRRDDRLQSRSISTPLLPQEVSGDHRRRGHAPVLKRADPVRFDDRPRRRCRWLPRRPAHKEHDRDTHQDRTHLDATEGRHRWPISPSPPRLSWRSSSALSCSLLAMTAHPKSPPHHHVVPTVAPDVPEVPTRRLPRRSLAASSTPTAPTTPTKPSPTSPRVPSRKCGGRWNSSEATRLERGDGIQDHGQRLRTTRR